MNTETIARRIKEQILSFDERLDVREQGRVMSCADGIARVSGLQDVMAGELLYFPHAVRGIAMNLEEDTVGAVLLDDARKVQAGDPVRRSGSVAGTRCLAMSSPRWDSRWMAACCRQRNSGRWKKKRRASWRGKV